MSAAGYPSIDHDSDRPKKSPRTCFSFTGNLKRTHAPRQQQGRDLCADSEEMSPNVVRRWCDPVERSIVAVERCGYKAWAPSSLADNAALLRRRIPNRQ